MDTIKKFFQNHGKTILYILALISLSVGIILIELPNINVDIRVNHSTKTTNKY